MKPNKTVLLSLAGTESPAKKSAKKGKKTTESAEANQEHPLQETANPSSESASK